MKMSFAVFVAALLLAAPAAHAFSVESVDSSSAKAMLGDPDERLDQMANPSTSDHGRVTSQFTSGEVSVGTVWQSSRGRGYGQSYAPGFSAPWQSNSSWPSPDGR